MTTRGSLTEAQRTKLKKIIQRNYSEQQFKTICFDLGVASHYLDNPLFELRIEALIDYHINHNSLYKLLDYLQYKQPQQDIWQNVMNSAAVKKRPFRRTKLLLLLLLLLLLAVPTAFWLAPTASSPPSPAVATPAAIQMSSSDAKRLVATETAVFVPVSQPPTATPLPSETAAIVTSETATQPPARTPTATPTPTTQTATATQLVTSTIPATAQIVTLQTVNVRQGPGTNYPVVANIAQGEQVTVVAQHQAENGLWYIVVLQNGRQGWVSSRVSQPVNAELFANLPPVATIPLVPLPTRAATLPNSPNNSPNSDDATGSLTASPVPDS